MARVRYYTQNAASFYSDLFPRANFQNFRRATASSRPSTATRRASGASYEFAIPRAAAGSTSSSANIRFDHLMIDYKDIRNALLIAPTAGLGRGQGAAVQAERQHIAGVRLDLVLSARCSPGTAWPPQRAPELSCAIGRPRCLQLATAEGDLSMRSRIRLFTILAGSAPCS